ncbi:hypothetical protein E1262_18470 [Jiangella aurantiaca]|uniref:Uncharacterized protein n=1 Tax=Jiangella aurantiaca TaxID=2530373 RepID=A0A4R5A957_9ACTN|nr:hypothetical protein [Jiangella aurantiaca]TDD67636.1 hypothetical protein E1262_18470 [Jiangella aurantiaca]
MTVTSRPSRRSLVTGTLAGLGLAAAGERVAAAPRAPRILVATNEPWGTYHVRPLLPEIARRGWDVRQLVPDRSQIAPGETVPVVTPDDEPAADLLVVTGATDWPADCAAAFGRHTPLAASSLAYLNAAEAPRAHEFERRQRLVTSSSAAEGRSFAGHLGTRRRVRVVGSPQTDALPTPAPEPDTVLVLTSVTYADQTGGAAPGTQLLLDAAAALQAAGKHIVVGLHPRENPALWSRYEISPVPSLQASARAEVAIGIPGTVFPLIAAAGVPVVGCVDPRLVVPDYLLAVCSSLIGTAAEALPAVETAALPDPGVLEDVVGPIGGSAARLLDTWGRAARPRHD